VETEIKHGLYGDEQAKEPSLLIIPSMALSIQPVAAGLLACAVAVALLVGRRFVRARRLPLPPGPKGHAVIGNLFDMPKENDCLVYSEWQKAYGDMVYVTVLGQRFLVVNSLKIAADLLEKRSTYYSGRMKLTFGGELCNHQRSVAFAEGDRNREARKLAHRALNPTAVKQWQSLQEAEAYKTLRKLLQTPSNFTKHFHHNAGSSIMRIVYGYELEGEDDPFLKHANKVMAEFSQACAPGHWMVDILPFLKHVPGWVPGAGFQNNALKMRANVDQLFDAPVDLVKNRMVDGTARPSMTSQWLDLDKEQADEEHIRSLAGTLYGGGVDTTPSALTSFVMAMVLYPEVQKKAQAELDSIVRTDRLPVIADRADLPYVEALIKEVLRWAPVSPMGLPHRLIKEDEYDGYRIPKNTIVMGNIWHMNRDTATYGADVDTFRPDRFLGPDPAPRGFSTSNTHEFGSAAFGFGRRVCPGEHFAFASLFILVSNILATMEISPLLGADEKPILPEVAFESGVTAHPKPFKCNITPRSAKAVELINNTALLA